VRGQAVAVVLVAFGLLTPISTPLNEAQAANQCSLARNYGFATAEATTLVYGVRAKVEYQTAAQCFGGIDPLASSAWVMLHNGNPPRQHGGWAQVGYAKFRTYNYSHRFSQWVKDCNGAPGPLCHLQSRFLPYISTDRLYTVRYDFNVGRLIMKIDGEEIARTDFNPFNHWFSLRSQLGGEVNNTQSDIPGVLTNNVSFGGIQKRTGPGNSWVAYGLTELNLNPIYNCRFHSQWGNRPVLVYIWTHPLTGICF
jgi:hypothetical protein